LENVDDVGLVLIQYCDVSIEVSIVTSRITYPKNSSSSFKNADRFAVRISVPSVAKHKFDPWTFSVTAQLLADSIST
jgi:hypothetical protein